VSVLSEGGERPAQIGRFQRSSIAWALACLWGLLATFVWANLTMNVREQRIGVRYVDGVTDAARLHLEDALGLTEAEQSEGTRWAYRLVDPSREHVERLVRDPLVADTAHVDRGAFRVELDRPDIWPWARYLLEVLPVPGIAVGLLLATPLLSVAGRRRIAPVVSRVLEAAGLTRGHAIVLAAAFLVLVAAFLALADNEPRWDERVHVRQIERFFRGEWRMEPELTTLPGFHVLVAAVAWLSGTARVPSVRLFEFEVALGVIAAFFFLARRRGPAHATQKTLQFVFLPILFPLLLLVYTDAASLGLVLLMALAAGDGRYRAAGLLGLASCLVRQNNILWVALVFVQAYVADHGWRWPSRPSSLLRYAPALLSGVAIAGWVAINRGQVAVGDVEAHPLGTPYLGNVFFLLFLSFFLFLPLWWGYRRTTWARLGRASTWAGLVATFVLFWLGFAADHPYNADDGFVRNELLAWMTSSRLHTLVCFVPIALTCVSVASLRLSATGWLVYPVAVAFLLPSWLIEQRYYLIPVALLLADREPLDGVTEWTQVALSAACSLGVFVLIERGTWML
jgi:alpha-1,2-glucosyltransferase